MLPLWEARAAKHERVFRLECLSKPSRDITLQRYL
jgi:hypothetical protein